MNDDVNVSGATAAIFTAIRNGNTLLSKLDDRADGDVARAEVRSALVAVRAMLDALGLDPLAEPWAGAAGADGNGESREHDVLDALITEQLTPAPKRASPATSPRRTRFATRWVPPASPSRTARKAARGV